jgi:TolA-binding protein
LFRLGRTLGRLGKVSEACVTLGEVGVRHAGTSAASSAQAEMAALSCN